MKYKSYALTEDWLNAELRYLIEAGRCQQCYDMKSTYKFSMIEIQEAHELGHKE